MRRCGRSVNREVRDTGSEMRLTDRTRLIPETRNEDDVGGRARVTRNEERVLRGG